MFGPAAVALTSAACLATPVHGSIVKAPPFTGRIAPQHDVVDGRFALHVGPLRDPATELSQKILWVLPGKYRKNVGPQLAFTWRLEGIVRSRARTYGTSRAGDSNYYFPSVLAPPLAGCWTLTLTTGRVRARLTVFVRDHSG
jgi:hypothetical protein